MTRSLNLLDLRIFSMVSPFTTVLKASLTQIPSFSLSSEVNPPDVGWDREGTVAPWLGVGKEIYLLLILATSPTVPEAPGIASF